ncbi:MAG: acyltransferase family protein [Bacilli bacterium]|nr:acyltransferase family protein [Bacilli bacterium]
MDEVETKLGEKRLATTNDNMPSEIRMPPKKRMVEQDIAKGFAILLVTLMHLLILEKTAFNIAGGLFGFIMSSFFLLAGYNYKPGRTYKENIVKRIKQILIPFAIYVCIIVIGFTLYFTLSGQVSFADAMETYGYSLLGSKFATQAGMANKFMEIYRSTMVSWFIIMLFNASFLFYAVVDWALKDIKNFLSVNAGLIIFTMVFGFLDFSLPLYLAEAPAIASIMLFGAMFKKYNVFELGGLKYRIINCIVAYALYIGMALSFKGAGYIMGGKLMRDYGAWEVLITLAYSILGTYSFLGLCKLLSYVKPLRFVFTWLGNNSMYILILHQPIAIIVREIMNYHPSGSISTSETTEYLTFAVWGITMVIMIAYILLLAFAKRKIRKIKDDRFARSKA